MVPTAFRGRGKRAGQRGPSAGGTTTQNHFAIPVIFPRTSPRKFLKSTTESNYERRRKRQHRSDYVEFTQPTVAGGKVFVTAGAPTHCDPAASTNLPAGTSGCLRIDEHDGGSAGGGTGNALSASGPVGWLDDKLTGPFVGTVEVPQLLQPDRSRCQTTSESDYGWQKLALIPDGWTGRDFPSGRALFTTSPTYRLARPSPHREAHSS